jgi:hypothetical protein
MPLHRNHRLQYTPRRKIRYLREVEDALCGLDRAMAQLEIAHAIKEDLRKPFSQPYLWQIESGSRPHLLAKFFKVHPGYLVDDPEGYSTELISDLGAFEDRLDLWLVSGAEPVSKDPGVCEELLALAKHPDSQRCLTLLKLILENPRHRSGPGAASEVESTGSGVSKFNFGSISAFPRAHYGALDKIAHTD